MKDIESPVELSTRFMQYLIGENIPSPGKMGKMGIPMRKLGALIGFLEEEMLDIEGLEDEIGEADATMTADDIRGSATMGASLCVGYLLGKNPEIAKGLAESAYKITERAAELPSRFVQYLIEENILPPRKLGIPMYKLGALIGFIEWDLRDLEDEIREADATMTDDDVRGSATMVASLYVGCLLGKNPEAVEELAELAYEMAKQG